METLQIGWIGTGVMGNAMCAHLIDAGYRVSVYNRSRPKADDLVAKGARWCDSSHAVAGQSDVVFSMVGFPHDVEQVLLGQDGVLVGAPPGTLVVDLTTSSPGLAQTIYAQAKAKELASLDAPVSGGDVGAREATLAIMVGGDREHFDRTLPLFRLMGKNIAYMGPAGTGQHTKMCNQIAIAGNMIGMVESLLYAHRTGMDIDRVIDVIGTGAAGSWSINHLGRRIAKNDFDPGFFIKHFVKDMGIALTEAKRMNLCLPGLALVNQFYTAAMAQGFETLGTQGLYKVMAQMNALSV